MISMQKEVISYKLYHWRYIIALLGLITLGAMLIILSFWYAPAGLRQAEITQISTLDLKTLFSSEQIIDFPYKLVQIVSLSLLGLSNFSIKLPSLLFGILSLIGLFWLIAHWINRKTALIGMTLILSTSQISILMQDGTPQIMFIFWQIVTLIILTKINRLTSDSQKLKATKNSAMIAIILPILGTVIGLSAYTPMMSFLPLLLIGLSLGHPKPRLVLKNLSFRFLLPGIIAFVLIISPLALQIITSPSIFSKLINLQVASGSFFQPLIDMVNFWSPQTDFLMQPIFSLGALAIALIGCYSLAQQYFSVRSMTIFYLLGINLIICLTLARSAAVLLWLPISLLIVYGIHSLTLSWMTIFPLNPYPRVFGILMISTLIILVSTAGIDTLFKNYAYNPALAGQFRQDLQILNKYLNKNQTTLVVADQTEYNFYQWLKKSQLKLEILDSKTEYSQALLTRQAFVKAGSLTATNILTDSHSQDFDRFYVYQKAQN